MKKYLLFLLAAILPALRIGAQQPPGVACQEWQVVAGDTIPHVRIRPVWVFARGADLRRYRKLVAAVKKVYPVADALPEGSTTVGAEMNVTHIKPSGLGAEIVATAVLTGVEGRKLTFNVGARDAEGMIGEGIHIRYAVDRRRFMEKVGK